MCCLVYKCENDVLDTECKDEKFKELEQQIIIFDNQKCKLFLFYLHREHVFLLAPVPEETNQGVIVMKKFNVSHNIRFVYMELDSIIQSFRNDEEYSIYFERGDSFMFGDGYFASKDENVLCSKVAQSVYLKLQDDKYYFLSSKEFSDKRVSVNVNKFESDDGEYYVITNLDAGSVVFQYESYVCVCSLNCMVTSHVPVIQMVLDTGYEMVEPETLIYTVVGEIAISDYEDKFFNGCNGNYHFADCFACVGDVMDNEFVYMANKYKRDYLDRL